MYEIFIGEAKVMEVPFPPYVYWDAVTGCFRTCGEEKAEALYITQEITESEATSYYADIEGNPHRHAGFPVAVIRVPNEEA